MRNLNARMLAGYLIVVAAFCFESLVAVAAGDHQNIKLSTEESAFLNCSLKCGANAEQDSIFSCLKECQDANKIPPKSVSKLLSISVGIGVTESECRDKLGDMNFVCPVFSGGCCCEGFFDCKEMETFVKGCVINGCATQGGREICTCKLD